MKAAVAACGSDIGDESEGFAFDGKVPKRTPCEQLRACRDSTSPTTAIASRPWPCTTRGPCLQVGDLYFGTLSSVRWRRRHRGVAKRHREELRAGEPALDWCVEEMADQ